MPGIVPVVGATEEEARAKAARIDDLIVIERGMSGLGSNFAVDLSGLDPDGPLPAHLFELDRASMSSRPALILDLAESEGLTMRQLVRRLGGGRGHYVLPGTAVQIADEMQRWVENGAADGFNVMPAQLPHGLQDFVDHVMPILRERGLAREGYRGTTLRENLGLPVPDNRLAGGPSAFG